jgi:digeranylgeranylglycerophospholipid reductase
LETYDVAVIGAGPAGVMAAWKSAESHGKTILIEREGSPGKKVCAEGVLSDVLTDAEVKPSPGFVSNEISGAFLYAPDESKRVNVGGEGYILDKPAFLRVLAERAVKAGATASYSTTVEDIERQDGLIEIRGKKDGEPSSVKARIVIGCDGTGSILARRFFPRKNYQAITALQYSMTNCEVEDESKLEIYVGHEKAPAGYIWVFPKGKGEANVGIGVKGAGAKALLDKFIEKHPRAFSAAGIERTLAAPVPVGGEVESYVADNMMLCGDAAGQVIPLTGAGIHTGLVAGKIAGEVAAVSAVKGNTSAENLQRYRDRFDKLWGQRISNSLKALDSFERFSDHELNIITGLLEGQDLVEMANGFSPTKAVGLMARHPLLAMKVAYQLLTG